MIRIQLCDLAKEFELGSVLMYRPIAKRMFQKTYGIIQCPKQGTMINCSFKNIEACDASFADEFIINIQKHLLKFPNVIFYISDCCETIIWDLKGALAVRNEKDNAKYNILIFKDSRFEFLGKIENNLLETFEFVQKNGSATARDLVPEFGIEINSAGNRLKKLYDSNKLFRDEIKDETGRQHVYYIKEQY